MELRPNFGAGHNVGRVCGSALKGRTFSENDFPEKPKTSLHQQRAIRLTGFGRKAIAQILHDLILQRLAARAPALRARELFHATAQTAEMQHFRVEQQLLAQLVAQALKEKQLETFAGFAGEQAEVRI